MAKAAKKSIGDFIDELGDLNAEISALNKQAETLKKKKDILQAELMTSMKDQGLSQSGGKRFKASITAEEVAQVQEWDKFYAFIARNKAFHLLQKRVSGPAMREVWKDRTRPVPGVNKVEIEKLSFRKA